jgi:hypothetical protein
MLSTVWASSDVVALASEHKHQLYRCAEASLTVLDASEFRDGRTFHVIDFTELGAPAKGYLGFTICHFHELAEEYLPRRVTTKPASAVALNIEALARHFSLPQPSPREAVLRRLQAQASAVAAHEYAHNVVATVMGQQLPEGFTLKQLIDGLGSKATQPEYHRKAHCESWLRAYIHLTTRGAANSCHPEEWQRSLRRDVLAARLGEVAAFTEALKEELARFDFTDRLADIIRSPAPAGFLETYQQRDAQRLNTEGGS